MVKLKRSPEHVLVYFNFIFNEFIIYAIHGEREITQAYTEIFYLHDHKI